MTDGPTDSADATAHLKFDEPDALAIARTMLRLLSGGDLDEQCSAMSRRDATDDEERYVPETSRHPDVSGAAVLFGLTLASSPALYDRLFDEAPVIVVECPADHWMRPLMAALSSCLGPGRSRGGGQLEDEAKSRLGAAVVMGELPSTRQQDDGPTARAIRAHRPVLAIIGPDQWKLSDDLERAREAHLRLAAFTPEALSLLITHVTGCEPSVLPSAELAAAVEPADLRVAVHSARGPDRSLERLAEVVGGRTRRPVGNAGPRLSDLSGYGAAAEWGLAAAADLAAYRRGEVGWFDLDPAIVLSGPPGTGKSSFAAALAREAGVPFLAGSLAQWHSAGSAHLGTTLKAMRGFFDDARKAAPCVALVDELDSFGDRNRFDGHDGHYWLQLVNGLLECLDGAVERAGVLLVGTTNACRRIDPAILRAGRFDRVIAIEPPSLTDLAAILRHHLGPDLPLTDLTPLARRGLGGTGADCAAWVRRARGRARRERRAIMETDVVREIAGSAASSDERYERYIAIHECGHVVVALALGLPVGDVVLRPPVSDYDGFCRVRPPKILTIDSTRSLLAVMMGGRAAEIVVFGNPSAGAADDLASATALAYDMQSRWGLGRSLVVRDRARGAVAIEPIVERELRRASRKAIGIVVARRRLLERLSRSLLERRSLAEADIGDMADEAGCPPRNARPDGTRLGLVDFRRTAAGIAT